MVHRIGNVQVTESIDGHGAGKVQPSSTGRAAITGIMLYGEPASGDVAYRSTVIGNLRIGFCRIPRDIGKRIFVFGYRSFRSWWRWNRFSRTCGTDAGNGSNHTRP